MAKLKTIYVCQNCGGHSPKWQGQCPHCHQWNTLQEEVIEVKTQKDPVSSTVAARQALAVTSSLQYLNAVQTAVIPRIPSGMAELDRVLGGGFVQGGVILIGGDPGIGKSTLLLQTLAHLAAQNYPDLLYVSGEESAQQIALRAHRLGIQDVAVQIFAEIQLEKIREACQQTQAKVVVIDSIQTIYTELLQSSPGSVSQVRECAVELTRYAKQHGTIMILIGHVTKEGTLAGPRILEHIVDTVLYFEGDTQSTFRLIRAFKNRFGAVNELGVFAMTDKGLKGVNNPSALFLSHHAQPVSGSCVTVTQEGSRPLLVEIQALVNDAHGNPRRLTVGLEQNRLAMLLAVLYRHAQIFCADQDVFLNAVSGVKITEPAADLAILMAIISSLKNTPLPEKMVIFGEVGLAGEIRPVQKGQDRLKEAAKLGFTHALIPKANQPKGMDLPELTVYAIARLDEAVQYCFR